MLLQQICDSDTQERQAPVCVSCMMDKAELFYSDVLKVLVSDLRVFPLLSVHHYLHTRIRIHGDSLCMTYSLCCFCLALYSHLFFLLIIWSSILPLLRHPLNVLNLADLFLQFLPPCSQVFCNIFASFRLMQLLPHRLLCMRPCAVSLGRASHC